MCNGMGSMNSDREVHAKFRKVRATHKKARIAT